MHRKILSRGTAFGRDDRGGEPRLAGAKGPGPSPRFWCRIFFLTKCWTSLCDLLVSGWRSVSYLIFCLAYRRSEVLGVIAPAVFWVLCLTASSLFRPRRFASCERRGFFIGGRSPRYDPRQCLGMPEAGHRPTGGLPPRIQHALPPCIANSICGGRQCAHAAASHPWAAARLANLIARLGKGVLHGGFLDSFRP